ncbi:MAG: epimerase [Peptococcaceae bacterium BICA1-7]|nr:MAG: epimerase [Peptococcaceae bacterium BICA1-7]HBV98191.1 epimerase [Desulfotomaculum sp.]
MKVIIFGATGMVGRGVLRECLLDSEVQAVLTVGRSATGLQHEKLSEIVHKDLQDLSTIEGHLSDYDACFFCLGVSSTGMAEQNYQRVTYDITLAVAQTLVKLNAGMTFIYVSGAGVDNTEKGRVMWARVKGKTENALLRLPFKAAYMFRPGYIQPMHGIVSKTKLYRVMYAVVGPLYPVWKRLFPEYVTTTEIVGRAMIKAARQGAPKPFIENKDINSITCA